MIFCVGGVHEAVPHDGVPVFHVGAAERAGNTFLMTQAETPRTFSDARATALVHSLECKGAAMVPLCSLKAGLFGWRAADQQELMWRVHEPQLLQCNKAIITKKPRQYNYFVLRSVKYLII